MSNSANSLDINSLTPQQRKMDLQQVFCIQEMLQHAFDQAVQSKWLKHDYRLIITDDSNDLQIQAIALTKQFDYDILLWVDHSGVAVNTDGLTCIASSDGEYWLDEGEPIDRAVAAQKLGSYGTKASVFFEQLVSDAMSAKIAAIAQTPIAS